MSLRGKGPKKAQPRKMTSKFIPYALSPLDFFFFFLRLGLPEEVLITLQIPSSNLTSFSSSYPKHNWIPIFLRHLAPRLFLAVNYNYSGI